MPESIRKEHAHVSDHEFILDVTEQFHRRPMLPPNQSKISRPEIHPEDVVYVGAMEVLNLRYLISYFVWRTSEDPKQTTS